MTTANLIDLTRIALMFGALALAVMTDVRERRIPNRLTAALAVAGLIFGALNGPSGLTLAVAGCLTGGLIFLVPVAKFGWGTGDLKLVAALGAVGGPVFVVWMALYALAAGGVFAFFWLKSQRQLAPVIASISGDLRAGRKPLARSGLAIPFAVPIAAGTLCALFISPGLPG